MPVIPRRELWLFVAVVLLWGVNWPMMKMALNSMGLWQFRALCVTSGVLWMLLYCLAKQVPMTLPRAQMRRMIACGVANTLAWNILAAAGLARLPSGRAALIAYSMPLWVVLLSRFILKERITKSRWIAISIGMLGIVLLLVDEIEILKRAPVGALLMAAAGFIWAFGIIITKGFPRSMATQVIVMWQTLIGGLPIVIGALFVFTGSWLPNAASGWLGLLFNVTLVFGFCHFAWNEIVRILPANVTGITSLSVPVIGVLSGMAILGERPRALDWAALAMLCAAVAIVVYVRPKSS